MKRSKLRLAAVLPLILSAVFAAAFFTPTALQETVLAAETVYIPIAEDGVILYTIDENYEYKPLFALPKTYYLEYTGRSNSSYYIVKYMDLNSALGRADLFVLKGAVSLTHTLKNISSPYPSVTVRNVLAGAVVSKTPDDSSAAALTLPSANLTLNYYGAFGGDSSWHYIGYAGVFGYIRSDALVEAPYIPPHPNSTADIKNGGAVKTSDGTLLTVILSAGIILPAVIIFILMFRPLRRKKRRAGFERAAAATAFPRHPRDLGEAKDGGDRQTSERRIPYKPYEPAYDPRYRHEEFTESRSFGRIPYDKY